MSYGLAVHPSQPSPDEREKARQYDEWIKGRTTFGSRPTTVREKAEAWDVLNGRNRSGWRT